MGLIDFFNDQFPIIFGCVVSVFLIGVTKSCTDLRNDFDDVHSW